MHWEVDCMSNAIDFAKFFLKRGLDTNRNSYDGNMKLQKLLFFADFISISETGKALFPEPILAFTNGCVVESVRLRYKNDCLGFCQDSEAFQPDFTQQEYDILNLTADIFGKLTARELSELNHSFSFWKAAYERSKDENGYKNKDLAIIKNSEMLEEIQRIKLVIEQYKTNRTERSASEIVNGVTFYHLPDFELSDEIMEELDKFSIVADEDAYSIYFEDGNLVIM